MSRRRLQERWRKRKPAVRARFLVRNGIEVIESRQPILRSRYFLWKNLGNACKWAFVFSDAVTLFCWWAIPDTGPGLRIFAFVIAYLHGIVFVYLGFQNRKILYSLAFLPAGLLYLRTLPKDKVLLPYEELRIRSVQGKNRDELGYLEHRLEIDHAGRCRLFPCADAGECENILGRLESRCAVDRGTPGLDNGFELSASNRDFD